jgi:hypothetical protein
MPFANLALSKEYHCASHLYQIFVAPEVVLDLYVFVGNIVAEVGDQKVQIILK